jgi:hypothetical protein
MQIVREQAVRKRVDKPSLTMLDLWHELSKQELGISVEVLVSSRREHPRLKDFGGELNTAQPLVLEGELRLLLLFESLSAFKHVIFTHELGHWVLKLSGHVSLIYDPDPLCDNEILLNSLRHHVPLYELQRSIGHEPQNEIDARAQHNLRLFKIEEEASLENIRIRNALMLADDFLNCSKEIASNLRQVISINHPHTNEKVQKILEIASFYKLSDKNENQKFGRMVIKKLKLGTNWSEAREVTSLRQMLKSTEDTNKLSRLRRQ